MFYGFAEGPKIAKRFHRAMRKAGGVSVEDPSQADIIICHSAGAYDCPTLENKPHILLIGPPYWPSKTLLTRLFHNVSDDFMTSIKQKQLAYWGYKTCWNIIYAVLHPVRNVRAAQHSQTNSFYGRFDDTRITILRNDNDAWLMPDVRQQLKHLTNISWQTLPGEHDNCWYEPVPYVDLILSMIKPSQHNEAK